MHANVVANDILRLKHSTDGQCDHSTLLTDHPMFCSCHTFQPSKSLLTMLWDIMLNWAKAAQTRDSRLIHFLTYINEYKLTDKYLNHSSSIVNDLLFRYVLLLFMGYGCTPWHIKSGMVLGYLMVNNAHYVEMGIHPPFVAKSKTKTAHLIPDTKKVRQNVQQDAHRLQSLGLGYCSIRLLWWIPPTGIHRRS